MNARERAMQAHPAGKGIPESDDVRWERETAEAIETANAVLRTYGWVDDDPDISPWQACLVPAVMVVCVFVLVMFFAVAGDMVAGVTS